jgi:hypothetical protein
LAGAPLHLENPSRRGCPTQCRKFLFAVDVSNVFHLKIRLIAKSALENAIETTGDRLKSQEIDSE